MPSRSASKTVVQAAEPDPDYDPYAIFDPDGPIHPGFMREAVRTLMRAMPLDPDEPPTLAARRMHAALIGLAALNPRDGIEVLLAVQALSAYHAAAANWRLAMNHHQPNGDSGRHASVAASSARTFDTMLKALERRQARPLAPPPGRPPKRAWPQEDPEAILADWTERCREEEPREMDHRTWTEDDIAMARSMGAAGQDSMDPPSIEGVLPGGGMIMPEHPTREQNEYMAQRLGLLYRGIMQDNRQKGIDGTPMIQATRPGDRIP